MKDSTTSAAPAERGFGRRAARGLLWTMLGTGIGRGASLLAMIPVGHLLGREDFAVWAVAVGLTALIAALRMGGATTILIQRGAQYRDIGRPFLFLTLSFDLTAGVLVALVALLAGRFYDQPELPAVIWILAAAMPLGSFKENLKAKLAIDLRFGSIAKINAMSSVLRAVSMVGFAVAGFGPLSFALPALVVVAFETVATWRCVRAWPPGGRFTLDFVRGVLGAAKWIVLGAIFVAMVNSGDYLVIGKLTSDEVLGAYAFGFQLVAAASIMLSSNLMSVLMPTFSRLSDESGRQSAAFVRALRVFSLVNAPLWMGAAVVAGSGVQLLWPGRWDDAVPVVQLMSIALMTRALAPLAVALVEARGHWALRAAMLGGDGVGTMAVAVIGAVTGGLVSIALWIAAYRTVVGVVYCVVAGSTLGIRPGTIVRIIAPPVLVTSLVGAGCFVLFEVIRPIPSPLGTGLAAGATYAAAMGLAAFTLLRSRWRESLAVVREMRRTGGGDRTA